MTMMQITIILELGDDLAEQLKDLTLKSHVWITETSSSMQKIESIWNSPEYCNPDNHFELTSFICKNGETLEMACQRILEEIDIHYPDWTNLLIHGVELNDDVREALEGIGVKKIVCEGGAIHGLAE